MFNDKLKVFLLIFYNAFENENSHNKQDREGEK